MGGCRSFRSGVVAFELVLLVVVVATFDTHFIKMFAGDLLKRYHAIPGKTMSGKWLLGGPKQKQFGLPCNRTIDAKGKEAKLDFRKFQKFFCFIM